MRKKLDTRFPAARIKKIMQTDEDVGKIAMAVPLLVSKALELFLQDLCKRTYRITMNKGAKTMNSFHLKQCVQTHNIFDFLRETVKKVSDLGGSDIGIGEDHSVAKRPFWLVQNLADEDNVGDDEIKRSKVHDEGQVCSGSKGRGRGRSKGRGRGRASGPPPTLQFHKFGDNLDSSPRDEKLNPILEKLNGAANNASVDSNQNLDSNSEITIRDFDLNVDLNENSDSTMVEQAVVLSFPRGSASKEIREEEIHGEIPGWSLSVIKELNIDPVKLASRMDDDDEDYDKED